MKLTNFQNFQLAILDYIKSGALSNPNDRYKSWEHCYLAFDNAISQINQGNQNGVDFDYLCQILSEYLSSWGMKRNSFLLDLDCKAHLNPIKLILLGTCKNKIPYRSLLNAHSIYYLNNTKTHMLDVLMELKEELKKSYQKLAVNVAANNSNFAKAMGIKPKKAIQISDTLISKIILGTPGACPAYDRNLRKSLSGGPIARAVFNRKSILDLSNFYNANCSAMNTLSKSFTRSLGKPYPEMKLLDLGLWLLGLI